MEIKKAKRGRKYQYEFSFKRKVCEELLQGQITIPELNRKYNLSSGGTVYRWLKWYQEEQKELVSLQPMENSQSISTPNSNIEKSDKNIEEELRLAKAKIATLETMIDIAEEQFNIEIRKKSGTKQSSE